MKQWMTKATAIALSGLMALSCLTGCGSRPAEPTKTAAHDKETEQVTDAAISLLSTHSDTAGKNETVYVIADALGNPQQTIVSTWLKNPDGADELRDHAELKDIKNVKGDETFSVSGSFRTWDISPTSHVPRFSRRSLRKVSGHRSSWLT